MAISTIDEILIQKSVSGDMAAFDQLVTRYQGKVYTIAYRFLGNHSDAGDLAQEAFIKAYRSLSSFRGDSSFLTWLYHITANVCRDELRRRQRHPTLSLDSLLEKRKLKGSGNKTEEAVLRQESRREVQAVLSSLPDDLRLILIMRELQGFSYEEIAVQLGVALGTVKSRLNRARFVLKEKLKAELANGSCLSQ